MKKGCKSWRNGLEKDARRCKGTRSKNRGWKGLESQHHPLLEKKWRRVRGRSKGGRSRWLLEEFGFDVFSNGHLL